MIMKEKLEEWLNSFQQTIRDFGRRNEYTAFTSEAFQKNFMSKIVRRTTSNVGDAMGYFLSTGNLISPTGLDLQQTSGFVVVAEKINFYVRYTPRQSLLPVSIH
jgi:DNA-directed RNA polymerase I subunit RPA2